MATRTVRVAEACGGACWFEYDYDDVTLRITAFRGRNYYVKGDSVAWLAVPGNQPRREATFGNTPTTITVSTQQAQRIQLVVTPRGALDGFDAFMYSIPPGT